MVHLQEAQFCAHTSATRNDPVDRERQPGETIEYSLDGAGVALVQRSHALVSALDQRTCRRW
jgi:hypothetical protein